MFSPFRILPIFAAALLLATGGHAGAQSANDYTLPKAESPLAPRLQGPVDSDSPIVQPTSKSTPNPSPASQAAVSIAKPTASAATAKAKASPAASPRPASLPKQIAPDLPSVPAAVPSPSVMASSIPTALPSASETVSEPIPLPDAVPSQAAMPGWDWPLTIGRSGLNLGLGLGLGLGAALLLALGWWLRRKRRSDAIDDDWPEADPDETASPAEPEQSAPQPAIGLGLNLAADRLSASLVNCTLDFQLEVENLGASPLTNIAIAADMIAASGSMSSAEHEALSRENMTECLRLDVVNPGKREMGKATLRVPLAALTPIRSGDMALLIPLVRLMATASGPDGQQLHSQRTYIIGEQPRVGEERLRPFRLDLGPRIYSDIDQRVLVTP